MGRWIAGRRWYFVVGALALLGFALRVVYGKLAHYPKGLGDDLYYHLVANNLAAGRGFSDPLKSLGQHGDPIFGHSGKPIPTAFHPPLFPAVLAAGSKLGLSSYEAHRWIGCALGGGTVATIGLIARRVASPGVGLLAAAAAAVYVPLIGDDAGLMSESLYGLLIGLTVLAALRFVDAPSGRRACVMGLAVGAAALTRSEALLLVLLLVPFAVRRAGPRRLRHLAIAVAGTALLVVPWSIRTSLVFHRPVTISTGDGAVLAGSNAHSTYYGPLLGAWDFRALNAPLPKGKDRNNEAARSVILRRKGLRYARDHAGRLAVVAPVRVLRTWSIYPWSPSEKVDFTALTLSRIHSLEWVALLSAWLAMLLSIAGALELRRRGSPLSPLLAPIVLVTIVSALFFGDVRFRDAAEISLVVLGTVGAAALWPRLVAAARGRRARAASVA